MRLMIYIKTSFLALLIFINISLVSFGRTKTKDNAELENRIIDKYTEKTLGNKFNLAILRQYYLNLDHFKEKYVLRTELSYSI